MKAGLDSLDGDERSCATRSSYRLGGAAWRPAGAIPRLRTAVVRSPNGDVVPYDSEPFDFGPDFVSRENIVPELDR